MKKTNNNIFTYIFPMFLLFFLMFVFGCDANTNNDISKEDAEKIYAKAIAEIPDMVYKGDKLELPSKIDDVNISYTFDKNEYFDSNYIIIKENNNSHTNININILIGEHNFTKKIKVHQNMNEYFKKVIEYIGDNFPKGVYSKNANFMYSYPGDNDLIITYKSLNPEYVTDAGAKIAHQFDEKVTIQCILNKHNIEYTHDIEFISMGISNDERMDIAVEYINDFIQNTSLSEGTVLPTSHPIYGGRMRWISEDPTIIYDYKTIHLPKEAKTTHLMCEVMYGSTEYRILTYEVNLSSRPSEITDEIYILTFLETVLSSTSDYLTLYDGTKANINTDYLIDEDIKKPNHEYYTDTVRPEVPQEKLNSLLYEGYQMPNEENVLWVVVHETGMSYAGDDALLLAKYQYNIAYGDAGRQASWGYTVDEKSIYQSFPDTYRLWHATDGKTIGGGNTNGIGIEMCVNKDGIYNVSMLNNAKLMAGLLYKYGLGMMNMKQHSDFYDVKSCPEIMRKDKRWYEYLMLISREYISQTILANYEITYETTMSKMSVDSIYDFTSLESGETTNLVVTINGNSHTIMVTKK